MPTYEMMLLIKTLPKPELTSAIKRFAQCILDKKGLLRSLENLGHRPMPYATSVHGIKHREAVYYLMKFDSDTRLIESITEEFSRDLDIIKQGVFRIAEPQAAPCTLHTDMLPPAYRPEVQRLVDIAKRTPKRFTHVFKYNSGLDYYPFQK